MRRHVIEASWQRRERGACCSSCYPLGSSATERVLVFGEDDYHHVGLVVGQLGQPVERVIGVGGVGTAGACEALSVADFVVGVDPCVSPHGDCFEPAEGVVGEGELATAMA